MARLAALAGVRNPLLADSAGESLAGLSTVNVIGALMGFVASAGGIGAFVGGLVGMMYRWVGHPTDPGLASVVGLVVGSFFGGVALVTILLLA